MTLFERAELLCDSLNDGARVNGSDVRYYLIENGRTHEFEIWAYRPGTMLLDHLTYRVRGDVIHTAEGEEFMLLPGSPEPVTCH